MGILKIIENFLRGEYWLHFTTAFLLSEILIKICRFPLSIYILIIFGNYIPLYTKKLTKF